MEDDSNGDNDIKVFIAEVLMLGKIKRGILRRCLKKEKLDLLTQVVSINKKLKVLDDLDEKKEKGQK